MAGGGSSQNSRRDKAGREISEKVQFTMCQLGPRYLVVGSNVMAKENVKKNS